MCMCSSICMLSDSCSRGEGCKINYLGLIPKESSYNNVCMYLCISSKVTKVEWRYTDDGERVRVSLRTGRIIPMPTMAEETYDYKDPKAYLGNAHFSYISIYLGSILLSLCVCACLLLRLSPSRQAVCKYSLQIIISRNEAFGLVGLFTCRPGRR